MRFLGSIEAWQWGIAGAIPLGILALYFLRLKRKPMQVSSTFLWKKSVEDLHVNALWQRLRKNILLLLQLLVAAAILFSLARPVSQATETGEHIIFLIDNSASMSATDVAPSRLESAKTKALEVIGAMKDGDSAMVIASNDKAQVMCSYTKNQALLRTSVQNIQPTARRTDHREAMTIASGLANPQKGGEEEAEGVAATLYLLSDGEFPTVSDMALGALTLKYVGIGVSAENVGILSLATKRNEKDPTRIQIFARIRNAGAKQRDVTAELYVDGEKTGIQQASVPGSGEQAMVFELRSPESASIRVHLDVADDLPLDNDAWCIISPPQRIKVLVVGDDNWLLKAALSTAAIEKLAEIDFLPRSYADRDFSTDLKAGRYQLIIFDRCEPKGMPECNTYFIGASPPGATLVKTTAVDDPTILNWASTHPALRYVSLDDVLVFKADAATLPQTCTPLIESDKGVLLYSQPRGIYRDIVQGFALVDEQGTPQTDWPLKLSFPLFVMNTIRLVGGADEESLKEHRPGDAINFHADEESETALITTPSGKRQELKKSRGGWFDLLDTDEAGIYTIEQKSGKRSVAFNLFDDRETRIEPVPEIQIGATTAADQRAEIKAQREWWRPLAAIAFALLLLEWYIYNRRVYV